MRHRCSQRLFTFRSTFASPIAVAFIALVLPASPSLAAPDADGLMGSGELASRLKAAARAHPEVVHADVLAKSASGLEAWRVELGVGTPAERASRPAMLVVAGLAGEDFAGTAACLAWLDSLAGDEALVAMPDGLLGRTTIHVVPRLDPDAAEAWLARPRGATRFSGAPVDDDHDGLVDEDGPDDLDGDGLIAWMRVEDPEGRHVPDPKEPRVLIEADRAKGEIPAWRYLAEGLDDDHDESWNEDGAGGTLLSRNFPFGYEWFGSSSGPHPVSEPLTRALADFIVAHPAIALAVVYGDADNLLGEPKGAQGEGKEGGAAAGRAGASAGAGTSRPGTRGASGGGGAGGGRGGARGGGDDAPPKPPTSVAADDVPYLAQFGKLYRETIGLEKPLDATSKPGALADWLYYHRGVMALSARPFSPALQVAITEAAKAKAEKEAKAKDAAAEQGSEAAKAADAGQDEVTAPTGEADAAGAAGDAEPPVDKPDSDDRKDRKSGGKRGGKGDDEDRGKDEREFLKWVDVHAPNRFVAWKAFTHPDFPGEKVEIGGFAPLAFELPPAAELAGACRAQTAFLTQLAAKLPRIGLRRATVRSLGKSVFEVTLDVENTGYLPTLLAHGVVTTAIAETRITMDLPDSAFLAGTKRTMLGPLAGGGGMEEARYVIHAPGTSRIDVEIVSALGGTVTTKVSLAETRP